MAVSGRQCNWFGISYFIVWGGALAICIWNAIKGMDGLGVSEGSSEEDIIDTEKSNPRLADAFTTATTVIAAVTFSLVGLELIMRSSMSAFLVYPCEFQKRTFCCLDYKMPSFWLMCVILTAVNLVVSVALTVLLIIMVGLDNIKIVRVAVVVGICLIQLIVAIISMRMSRACFAKEKAEAEVDMFEENEEQVPLQEPEEEFDIPKSPIVRSPMLGESHGGIPRPMPVGTPSHRVAMEHMQPSMSPRYVSSLGLAKSPASPYAVSAIKNSGNVGRYSPTVRQFN